MTREFDIVLPGDVLPQDAIDAGNEIRSEVFSRISRNQELISRFEIHDVPEEVAAGVGLAKQWLSDIHTQSGIPVTTESIPDPAFIDRRGRWLLSTTFKLLHEFSDFKDLYAVDEIMFGKPLIFVYPSSLSLDLVTTAAHELHHYTSRNIVTKVNGHAFSARSGFWVVGSGSSHREAWFLDEGIVESEAIRFRESLLAHPLFAGDADALRTALENKMATGDFDGTNLLFSDKSSVPARYCHALKKHQRGADDEYYMSHAGLSTYAALGVDLLVSGFSSSEQEWFRGLLRRGRYDFSLIPEITRSIDAVWGKGTYNSLLTCSYTEEGSWSIVEQFYDKGAQLPLKFSW